MSSIAMEVCPQQKSVWFSFLMILIFWCDKFNDGNRHRLHRTHLYVVQPSRRSCACSPSRRRSPGWDHWFIVPEHDDMDLYWVLVYILSMMMTMMKDLRIIIIVTVSLLFFYYRIIFYYLLVSLSLTIGVFNISNFVDSGVFVLNYWWVGFIVISSVTLLILIVIITFSIYCYYDYYVLFYSVISIYSFVFCFLYIIFSVWHLLFTLILIVVVFTIMHFDADANAAADGGSDSACECCVFSNGNTGCVCFMHVTVHLASPRVFSSTWELSKRSSCCV